MVRFRLHTISITVALCLLPLWWIWILLWQLGCIRIVSQVAFFFHPPKLQESLITIAQERAFAITTQGTSSQGDLLFSQNEVAHLLDVHAIYSALQNLIHILAILCWSVLIIAVGKKVDIFPSLRIASRFFGVAFLSILPLSFAFSVFFTYFHLLLFPQGNWQFPENSLLITLFPEEFWRLQMGAITLWLGVFYFLYRFLSSNKKKE